MKNRIGRALRRELRGVRMSEDLRARILEGARTRDARFQPRRREGRALLCAAAMVILAGLIALAVSAARVKPDYQRSAVASHGGAGGHRGASAVATPLSTEAPAVATVSPLPTPERTAPSAISAMPTPEVTPLPTEPVWDYPTVPPDIAIQEDFGETAVSFTPPPEHVSAAIPGPESGAADDLSVVTTPIPTPVPTVMEGARESAADVSAQSFSAAVSLRARRYDSGVLLEADFPIDFAVYDSVISANGWAAEYAGDPDDARALIAQLAGSEVADAWRQAYAGKFSAGVHGTTFDIAIEDPDSNGFYWIDDMTHDGTFAFVDPDRPGRAAWFCLPDSEPDADRLEVRLRQIAVSAFYRDEELYGDSTVMPFPDVRIMDLTCQTIEGDSWTTWEELTPDLYEDCAVVSLSLPSSGALEFDTMDVRVGDALWTILRIDLADSGAILVLEPVSDDGETIPAPTLSEAWAEGREAAMALNRLHCAPERFGWYFPDGIAPDNAVTIQTASGQTCVLTGTTLSILAESPESRLSESVFDAE